jgi:hypothetical protein
MDEESLIPFKIPYLPDSAPLANQPDGIVLPLYKHQLRSLYRMLQIESLLNGFVATTIPKRKNENNGDPYAKFNFGHVRYISLSQCLYRA